MNIGSVDIFKRELSNGQDPERRFGPYELVHMDALAWLNQRDSQSIHAVVTDPPFSLVEYDEDQLAKKKSRNGGVWRIPPSFDGHTRSPLPRFTVMTEADRVRMCDFFSEFASRLMRVLVPGAHVFIATNPLISHLVYRPLIERGFEKRGEVIRLVSTLRGGDRPKNAHREFAGVTVMPRSGYEPWGIFRKPLDGRVQDNLRFWKTGGLRRLSDNEPFKDVIESGVARSLERKIAPHPSLKPQRFMRQLVGASLPLRDGVILDPFMGSGSTIAAASVCGLESIGIEKNAEFFDMAEAAVPKLRQVPV